MTCGRKLSGGEVAGNFPYLELKDTANKFTPVNNLINFMRYYCKSDISVLL